MKCTVTIDLHADKNGYSGIIKHTEHDPNINHSNKDINFNESQFNLCKTDTSKLNKWNKNKFDEFVKVHDKKQRKSGHADRQYGSVKNYLKSKNKATMILTIGNMEIQTELMKRFCSSDSFHVEKLSDGTEHGVFNLKTKSDIDEAKKFYDCFNKALEMATADNVGWTKKKSGKRVNVSDYLCRGRYAIHNDELGMSHIHCEIGTFGLTRKGNRPTNSLNQALTSLYKAVNGKTVSGREATKWYRNNVDRYALQCLEYELHETYKVPAKEHILEFDRKSKHADVITGRSMEQLKVDKSRIADNKKQLDEIKQQQEEVTKIKEQAINALKSSYKAVTGHEPVNKDGTPLSPLELSEGLKKAVDDTKKEKANQDDELERLKSEQVEQRNQFNDELKQLQSRIATKQVESDRLDEEQKQKKQLMKRRNREIEKNVEKAKQFDLIEKEVGPVPPNKSLSQWVKSQLEFGRQQGKLVMKLSTEVNELKKSLIKVGQLFYQVKNDVKYTDDNWITGIQKAIDDHYETEFPKQTKKSNVIQFKQDDGPDL